MMDKLKAAAELGFNCQIENGKLSKDLNGLIVDFTPIELEQIETKASYIQSINEPSKQEERKWIESELTRVRDLIEDAEDTLTKVPKLRAYRQALKQYKSDLYMPNVSRPKL